MRDVLGGSPNQYEKNHDPFAEEQQQGKPVLRLELPRPDPYQEPCVTEYKEHLLHSIE